MKINILIYKLIRFILTQYFIFTRKIFNPSFFKKELIMNINNYRMYLDIKNDKGLSRDLFYFKTRELTSVNFLKYSNVLEKGDSVLDIGANIGYYALLESLLVGSSGNVYAIEPVKKNLINLKRNISLNRFKNIKTFHLAVGEKDGEALINVGKKGNLSSFIHRKNINFEGKEKVKVFSVDNFLKDKKIPKLIRMDIEGYEYAVLNGMKKTLDHNINLLIEVHPFIITKDQLDKMFDLLLQKGYKKATILHEPYLGWLNKKQEIRPIIEFFTKKIGDTQKLGTKRKVRLLDLKEFLIKKNSIAHVFFSK